jgi:uncharacterized protein DUF5999
MAITRRRATDLRPARKCPHTPPCSAATDPGRLAAVIVGSDPGREWWLLCNGLTVFDSSGYLFALSHSDLDHRNAA